jgi:predicted lipoprotein with Yx(FWY)xxD motif
MLALTAAALIAASLAAPLAGASAGRATLKLRQTSVGKILVNGRGRTLYAYSRDTRNKDNCVKTPLCPGLWPVLATSGRPIAGPGVRRSLIGTITPKPGVKQVTYAGHPLYTYVGDTSPGQTSYVNIYQAGGFWPALNAAGKEVK